MAFSRDPLDELAVPDGTEAKEVALETDGDVLVGSRSTIDFGVRGRNVLAGESVEFGGDIEAEGDCRLDMWCDVANNVLVGQDAYIGERVHVGGEMKVAGDLDIGDDVEIEEGFEANGWIVIRNPMPTIVFLFVYLKQLLLIGEEDAAQRLISELVDEDEEVEADPLIVPRNATVSDDAWRVSTPATIGDDCRLHGNIRAETIDVGSDCNVFGSLRARDDVSVGEGTRIHGDLTTRSGDVVIERDARILGDVSCENLALGPGAEVDGSIRADGEITMRTTERERE
ncbi:polymer-forming cytoskeletal protein [Natronococcus wangiae]|uniref:polymer-forming cytoskeletal protein n=1 Tax=Natronococcus wangiae TaxID=3068275 RepID=UPI00273F9C18|nr:polymer-forming cytoskeletal protein [Natronococcus sp. AD5]